MILKKQASLGGVNGDKQPNLESRGSKKKFTGNPANEELKENNMLHQKK